MVSKEIHYYNQIEPRFSPCGNFIVARWDSDVCIWKVSENDVSLELELKHDDDIYTMDFSQDGNFLAVGNGRYKVRLWDF